MNKYIGTKIINAKPMNRLDYNKLRGWELPSDETGEEEGYLVEYVDSENSNLTGFDGYVSWSPAVEFNKAYRQASGLTFGLALEALKLGKRIARLGWNGKDMWLDYIDPYRNLHYDVCELDDCPTLLPYIAMKPVGNQLIPWLASQSDMLSEDWVILEYINDLENNVK